MSSKSLPEHIDTEPVYLTAYERRAHDGEDWVFRCVRDHSVDPANPAACQFEPLRPHSEPAPIPLEEEVRNLMNAGRVFWAHDPRGALRMARQGVEESMRAGTRSRERAGLLLDRLAIEEEQT